MAKIIGNTTATPNPRPDWAQTDETKADYIKNKPEILTEDDANQMIETIKNTYATKSEVQALATNAITAITDLGNEVSTLAENAQKSITDLYDQVEDIKETGVSGIDLSDSMIRGLREGGIVVFNTDPSKDDVSQSGANLKVKVDGPLFKDNIKISSCEDFTAWSLYSTNQQLFSTDSEDYTDGIAINGWTNEHFVLSHKLVYTKDISEMKYLCFDMKVSTDDESVSAADIWNGEVLNIELGSLWDEDRAEIEHAYEMTEFENDTWKRVVIPLECKQLRTEGFCNSGITAEQFDNTKWKRIRFYKTGSNKNNKKPIVIKIDNLFFAKTKNAVVNYPLGIVLMSSGSNLLDGAKRSAEQTKNGITVKHTENNNAYVFNGTTQEQGFNIYTLDYYSNTELNDQVVWLQNQNLVLSSLIHSGKITTNTALPINAHFNPDVRFAVSVFDTNKQEAMSYEIDITKPGSYININLTSGNQCILNGSTFIVGQAQAELPERDPFYTGETNVTNYTSSGYTIVDDAEKGKVLSYEVATGTESKDMRFWIEKPGQTDINGIKYVTFDFYCDNNNTLQNTLFDIHLTTCRANVNGGPNLNVYRQRLKDVVDTAPVAGQWNTIRINVDKFKTGGQNPETLDKSKIIGFCFAVDRDKQGVFAQAGTYKFGNVRFERDEPTTIDDVDIVFDNFSVNIQLEEGTERRQLTNYQKPKKYKIAGDGTISAEVKTFIPITHLTIRAEDRSKAILSNLYYSIRAEYNKDTNKAIGSLLERIATLENTLLTK